jgi:hypothetical protein
VTSELQPRWLQQVNDAMDLPLPDARRVLAEVLAERRQRSADLRELAAQGSDAHRRAYEGMADWVDDSIGLVEQAAARLADLHATGEVATGREQIDRELRASGPITGQPALDGDARSQRGWSL